MLKNIDSYSPDKIQDFFVEPTIFEKSEYERSELTRKEDKKGKTSSSDEFNTGLWKYFDYWKERMW